MGLERAGAAVGQSWLVDLCQQNEVHVPFTFSWDILPPEQFKIMSKTFHWFLADVYPSSLVASSSRSFPSPLLCNFWIFHRTALRASGSFLCIFHWLVMSEMLVWFHLLAQYKQKRATRSHIRSLSCLFRCSKDKTSGIGDHHLLQNERKREYKIYCKENPKLGFSVKLWEQRDGREKWERTPLWHCQMKSRKQRWYLVLLGRVFLESLVLSFHEQWGCPYVCTHTRQRMGKWGHSVACLRVGAFTVVGLDWAPGHQREVMEPSTSPPLMNHFHRGGGRDGPQQPSDCSLPSFSFLIQTSIGFCWPRY